MLVRIALFTVISIYFVLFVLKGILAVLYWRKHDQEKSTLKDISTDNAKAVLNIEDGEFLEKNEFSVILPIVSGDPSLKNNLIKNLKNLNFAYFIWLIDRGDKEAERITEEIINESIDFKSRVTVVEVDEPPIGVNPKVYKMKHALPYLRKYTILLDDDAIIERDKFQKVLKYLKEGNCLVTGIPCHKSAPGFFSKLVTAFVNVNSFFTYLPMAFITSPKTVSGSFCVLETEALKKYDIFPKIEHKLCDEYEIAQICRSNNVKIVQSTVPINMTVSIKDLKHYVTLMKRWMVFANDYFKQSISLKELIVVALPSILPVLALTLSILCGPMYLGIWFGVHIFKVLYYRIIRQSLIKKRESYRDIWFEILAEYLQTLHFINALISPRKIKWRNNIIKLSKDGSILVDNRN